LGLVSVNPKYLGFIIKHTITRGGISAGELGDGI